MGLLEDKELGTDLMHERTTGSLFASKAPHAGKRHSSSLQHR